jgi:L-amino acid N-acyltransferase YncA
VIRRACESDATIIAEIYNEAIEDRQFATCDVKTVTVESRLAWLASHKDPFPVFVIEDETNVVIGWSALNQFSVRPTYPSIAEISVYVRRRHRNRFTGGRLFLHTISAAKELGFQSLVSLTLEKNTASIRGLMAVGFRKALCLSEVAMLHGQRVNVAWLQKDLKGDWERELAEYRKRLLVGDETDAHLVEAYNRYRKAIDEIARESQTSCEQAERSYIAAVKDACKSGATEESLDNAYHNYMKALLEAWGAEETRQCTEEAHLEYLQKLRNTSERSEERRRVEDHQRCYEQSLQRAWSPEVASKCSAAYHEYLRALETASESTHRRANAVRTR